MIFDLSSGHSTSLYWPICSKSTVPLGGSRVRMFSSAPPANRIGKYEELGSSPQEILGYQTVHIIHRGPKVGGRCKSPLYVEQWRAPELGCEVLREEIYKLDRATGEKQRLLSMKQAVAISKVSLPELFHVPADFVERSPSEVAREFARLEGRECRDCERITVSRVDERYYRLRQEAGWE